jgi:hypothetical protein
MLVVCPFVLFLLAIVLSVLRFADSHYPFGIFKYFLVYIMTRIGYIPMKEIIIGTKLKLWNILSTVIYSTYADAAGMLIHVHINEKFTMGKLK